MPRAPQRMTDFGETSAFSRGSSTCREDQAVMVAALAPRCRDIAGRHHVSVLRRGRLTMLAGLEHRPPGAEDEIHVAADQAGRGSGCARHRQTGVLVAGDRAPCATGGTVGTLGHASGHVGGSLVYVRIDRLARVVAR